MLILLLVFFVFSFNIGGRASGTAFPGRAWEREKRENEKGSTSRFLFVERAWERLYLRLCLPF